jgi:hypothetical protein
MDGEPIPTDISESLSRPIIVRNQGLSDGMPQAANEPGIASDPPVTITNMGPDGEWDFLAPPKIEDESDHFFTDSPQRSPPPPDEDSDAVVPPVDSSDEPPRAQKKSPPKPICMIQVNRAIVSSQIETRSYENYE